MATTAPVGEALGDAQADALAAAGDQNLHHESVMTYWTGLSSKIVAPIRSYTSGLALRQYSASAIDPTNSATTMKGMDLKNRDPEAAPAATAMFDIIR